MAMRITTKMMQSRSLNNLNTNKTLQEKLTTQLSTMKKITRPSDDPVIAIRSLKLNSSLNRIDQYYEKNSKDAKSWIQLTESAIKTTAEIITGMNTYIERAAQGSLEASDRAAILENLSNYAKEIYATGNADSDGRSIFTGYRTNTALTFQEDKTEKYEIMEQRTNACLSTTTFVRTGDLPTINEGNFNSGDKKTTEYEVGAYQIPRIRLAYTNLDYDVKDPDPNVDKAVVDISFQVETKVEPKDADHPKDDLGVTVNTTSYAVFIEQDNLSVTIKDADGNLVKDDMGADIDSIDLTAGPITLAGGAMKLERDAATGQIVIVENDGTEHEKTTTLDCEETSPGNFKFADLYETKLSVTDKVASARIYDETTKTYSFAYDMVRGEENANKIVYVADTGELLLGTSIQAQLAGLPTTANIKISYEKSNWNKGDLDPIHYFYTKRFEDQNPDPNKYEANRDKYILYNEDRVNDPTGDNAKQIISYDIGNNQSIRVNTTAEEVFTHDIGRDVNEVINMLNDFVTLEETYNKITDLIKSGKYDNDDLKTLEEQQRALDKARALAKDKVQKTCSGLLGTFDGYLKQTTLAYTDVGARDSRLNLIQNRLGQQQTNFEELVSENEDADVTELAIQLSSVELTYEAALSSISYVMKTTLLDFI